MDFFFFTLLHPSGLEEVTGPEEVGATQVEVSYLASTLFCVGRWRSCLQEGVQGQGRGSGQLGRKVKVKVIWKVM